MRKYRFKARCNNIDWLNELNVPHENGWVVGNLVYDGNTPYITGDVVDLNDEYINFEWWIPVVAESIRMEE